MLRYSFAGKNRMKNKGQLGDSMLSTLLWVVFLIIVGIGIAALLKNLIG